ncbi:MAG: hypothetical protein AB1736_09170 [Chloroflexota bacterium]
MDRSDWWMALPRTAFDALGQTWIPVGAPGFAGLEKARWRDLLDGRFGPDGWRLGHVVRGRIVGPAEAIVEYEASYRVFLRDRRALVAFLAATCGNVYDDRVENVFSDTYDQPDTPSNHYQDVAVRRVVGTPPPPPPRRGPPGGAAASSPTIPPGPR